GYEHLLEAVRDDARNATGATRQRTAARILGIREEPEEIYLDAVARAKRYIREGDIFQANLARTWRGEWDGEADAGTVYRRLRRSNPAPFAGLARWRDMAIISSSPERLLRLADGWAETRPIAGTRPRGATATADAALRKELIDHPKERAEHIMLIDLERNDLGRICEAGTVSVDEYMTLESYAHVHHIVSNIRGRARAGVTPGEAIRAVFPGGTITGCPKVRCMEIISELEVTPRGAYTGAMGYLGRDGRLDLNILIRTLVQHRDYFTLHAGAGIVADSRPVEELKETRAKAKGVLTALTGDEGSG
ncbi:MAG: chorismate-binding protein, partial [Deltaproteobacteria bacterium]|nr:chorismate-binding protein [Deltaproteobacteria bacterium]